MLASSDGVYEKGYAMLKKLWFLITSVPGLTWAKHPGDIYLRLSAGREPMPKWLDMCVSVLSVVVALWCYFSTVNMLLRVTGSIVGQDPTYTKEVIGAVVCFVGIIAVGLFLYSLVKDFLSAWRTRNTRLAIVELEGDRYASFCLVKAGQEKLQGELVRGYCHWFWGPGPLGEWDVRLGMRDALVRDASGVMVTFPALEPSPEHVDRLKAQGTVLCRMTWLLRYGVDQGGMRRWSDLFRCAVTHQIENDSERLRLERVIEESEFEFDRLNYRLMGYEAVLRHLAEHFAGGRTTAHHKKLAELLAEGGPVEMLIEQHLERVMSEAEQVKDNPGMAMDSLPDRIVKEIDWPPLPRARKKKPKPA